MVFFVDDVRLEEMTDGSNLDGEGVAGVKRLGRRERIEASAPVIGGAGSVAAGGCQQKAAATAVAVGP